ncbi:MAG: GNAT family N-acetyltransferase [Acholeplasmatales bacterium]|nr:GNAT family N-acetyltransferase [Acholeplasmatales bacterium]
MDLNIKNNIMPSDYKRIRKDVEWHFLRDFEISKLLNNSDIKVSIYDNDLCVGVGRCLTDNVNLFLICDVMVMKEYQGKGIGKLIVNNLIDRIKNINSTDKYIYVMSVKGKEGFYEALGFKKDIKSGYCIHLLGDK